MISRPGVIDRVLRTFLVHPIAAVLGPRQCGKTTLARMLAEREPSSYYDLENPTDAQRLSNPLQAMESLSGLIIIDEIQRKPQLFEILRVLADRPGNPARFLVLGSASPTLIKGISESLAGRVGLIDMSGFSLSEVGVGQQERLWIFGGFPRSFLAPESSASMMWRQDFIRTFLERDIPQLGITIPAETLRRFWTMIAHYHGQVWNASDIGRSLGVSEHTTRRYLDILAGAYMVRILPPWFENLKKRQVKSPKIYIQDSGILHALLQQPSLRELQGHPKLGASWEGFALQEVLAVLQTRDAYFWGTHAGAELDLLVLAKGKRYGFEFKYADAPGRSRSMHAAIHSLNLSHLWVVCPGKEEYALENNISVVPLSSIKSRVRSKLSNTS